MTAGINLAYRFESNQEGRIVALPASRRSHELHDCPERLGGTLMYYYRAAA